MNFCNLPRLMPLFGLFLAWLNSGFALAGIHSAPVVIPAFKIRAIASHPISMYRIFRTKKDGTAEPIPFQID
jgi:hypothetical protein